MSTLVWMLLVSLYLTALFVLGVATLRKGHTILFWLGILFPFLWIVGALMEPTAAVAGAQAGNRL
ncbi:MAG TPA: hypothetical protein VHK45_04515 [Geminicoccaceae bacterium]|jgi:hypothetical protein|nr:hypothetical protein [Geminicoccaceae bacterium]